MFNMGPEYAYVYRSVNHFTNYNVRHKFQERHEIIKQYKLSNYIYSSKSD